MLANMLHEGFNMLNRNTETPLCHLTRIKNCCCARGDYCIARKAPPPITWLW